jgi:hypothetical protein
MVNTPRRRTRHTVSANVDGSPRHRGRGRADLPVIVDALMGEEIFCGTHFGAIERPALGGSWGRFAGTLDARGPASRP